MYRRAQGHLEVLLVHPGGPFWTKKDLGAWSIPKGEAEPGEDLFTRAQQEFHEETGLTVDGPFTRLAPAKQSAKVVHAWAAEGDCDPNAIVSNTFRLEFPPRSGQFREYPEVDRAGWFDLLTARKKIVVGQRVLLDELERLLV